MKSTIAVIIPYLIALAAASPLVLDKRSDPLPPAAGQSVRCETSDNSPGVSNVIVSANLVSSMGNCVHNGGKTELRHDTGVRLYMFGPAGTFPCSVVAQKLYDLGAQCEANVNSDIRVGGSIYLIDSNDGTYLNVSE